MDKKSGLSDSLGGRESYSAAPHIPQVDAKENPHGQFDNFRKQLIKKFPFTISLGVIPSQFYKPFEEDEGMTPEEVARKPTHLFWVIPEEEFQNIQKKIKPELLKLIQESKHNLWVHIKTPVDVWNYGLDSKFEFLDALGASYPLHDKGFLGALRVASIHKTLVLRKFEKYVASYVVGGSLVRGTADADSDVDTFVVIDDTDVKKMPRLQLKEKLRSFIYDYIREATAYAGVKNVLNVQVYLLTEFWESVKDANPVIFTFIRDGVPMYDRGTFLPWKLLLRMGKIKPSPEAVDTFMKYGDQNESLVKRRLIDAMIDIYWGVVTPTQALMMLAGEAPPAPKTIVADVKRLFVEKEKIMSLKELKILEKIVKLYKDYEHGKLESMKGAEVDQLLKDSAHYDAQLKIMRKKLESHLVQNTALKVHDEVFDILKSMFAQSGKEKLVSQFKNDLVKKGKMPQRFVSVLQAVAALPQKVKQGKMTHNEIELVRRDAAEVINSLTEYNQRRDLSQLSKATMLISYDKGRAELVSTESGIYVVSPMGVHHFKENGFVACSKEELESALMKRAVDFKLTLGLVKALEKLFGEYTLSL